MAQKTCPNIQKSISWCPGTPEFAGLRDKIYYISKYDIVKWPTLAKDELGRVTDTKYTGDFVLAAEKKWLSILTIGSKSKFSSEPQGELPSQTQLNKAEFVIPNCDADATAAALFLNNNDNIFLIQTRNGKFRVIGSEPWNIVTKVTQDGGEGDTGTPKTTIAVEATDFCPAPFYLGKVETEDGIFMADGSEVPVL